MAIQKTWKELSRELFKIFPVACSVPACLPVRLPACVEICALASVGAGVGVGALVPTTGSLVVLSNYFSSIFNKF